MTREAEFIDLLRPLAAAGARGFADDGAVLEVGGTRLVLTHDMIVEGVHFLAQDPPADVAWKLVAVNLSDLAAKGARPIAALLGYTLGYTLGDGEWDRAFAAGLAEALAAFDLPLLGGDTVSAPVRALGLTAIGEAAGPVPSRSGAKAGDQLWVSGEIGGAGAGLELLQAGRTEPAFLVQRYRRPEPRLVAGLRLAPLASAMMDVSDGLLIDAGRIAAASGVSIGIDLAAVPIAEGAARDRAVTAGDDYELLFTAPPAAERAIRAVSEALGLPLTRIGSASAGQGLSLVDNGRPVALPDRLGWEHRQPG